MASLQKLAEDLKTLSGAHFVVNGDVVETKTGTDLEQQALLSRACQQTGLHMKVKLARKLGGGNDSIPEVDRRELTEDAALRISDMAADERARVSRLETAKDILEEKLGWPVNFEPSHKMLVLLDPLSTESHLDREPAREILNRINELKSRRIISSDHVASRMHGSAIAVFDVPTPERLADVQGQELTRAAMYEGSRR